MVVVAVLVVMAMMVIAVTVVGDDGEYQDIILSHKVGEATPKMMR